VLQVATLQVTRTQVHPSRVRRGGAECVQVCTTCHHTCVRMGVLPATAAAAHASARARPLQSTRARARAGRPHSLGIGGRRAPTGAGSVCGGGWGRQGCMRASRHQRWQPGVVWCGVGWCGVVWAGVVWSSVVRCNGRVGRCKHGDASTAQHTRTLSSSWCCSHHRCRHHRHHQCTLLPPAAHMLLARTHEGGAERRGASPAHGINSAAHTYSTHTRTTTAGRQASRQASAAPEQRGGMV